MVVEISGVVKLVPVPNEVPPVGVSYQLMTPAEAVAPSTTVPVPQLEPGVVPVIVGVASMLMSLPLSVPVTTGVLLTTRILYRCKMAILRLCRW